MVSILDYTVASAAGGDAVGAAGGAAVGAAGGAASAAPRLARATVGGVERVVGGWAEYEIARRAAARSRPGARYPGRTYIHAGDAARSIAASVAQRLGGAAGGAADAVPAGRRGALDRAAERLARALDVLEDQLCEGDPWEGVALRAGPAAATLVVPALTAADLRDFDEGDPEALYELAGAAAALAAATGVAVPPPLPAARAPLPALPPQAVPTGDDAAVLEVEASAGPYLASLEELRAALATRLDATAAALERRLEKMGDRDELL